MLVLTGTAWSDTLGTLSYTPTSTWNANDFAPLTVDQLMTAAAKPAAAHQETLILEHLSTVKFLARKLQKTLPEHIEIDELIAAGTLGLVDAAARFQPESGVLFATFAQFRIRGAMLDSLRDLDWAPRELRRKARSVEEAMSQVTRRTGRAPEEAEVASEMKLALSDYQILLGELAGLEIGSLHVAHGEESEEEEIAYVAGSPEEDPLFQCLRSEMRQSLSAAIEELPERERLVLTLSFYEEMTLKEIGQMLHLAESRISQIRSSAVLKLRTALKGGVGTQDKSRALRSAA